MRTCKLPQGIAMDEEDYSGSFLQRTPFKSVMKAAELLNLFIVKMNGPAIPHGPISNSYISITF